MSSTAAAAVAVAAVPAAAVSPAVPAVRESIKRDARRPRRLPSLPPGPPPPPPPSSCCRIFTDTDRIRSSILHAAPPLPRAGAPGTTAPRSGGSAPAAMPPLLLLARGGGAAAPADSAASWAHVLLDRCPPPSDNGKANENVWCLGDGTIAAVASTTSRMLGLRDSCRPDAEDTAFLECSSDKVRDAHDGCRGDGAAAAAANAKVTSAVLRVPALAANVAAKPAALCALAAANAEAMSVALCELAAANAAATSAELFASAVRKAWRTTTVAAEAAAAGGHTSGGCGARSRSCALAGVAGAASIGGSAFCGSGVTSGSSAAARGGACCKADGGGGIGCRARVGASCRTSALNGAAAPPNSGSRVASGALWKGGRASSSFALGRSYFFHAVPACEWVSRGGGKAVEVFALPRDALMQLGGKGSEISGGKDKLGGKGSEISGGKDKLGGKGPEISGRQG
eukprot:364571-Chlamydomonas_euryale.AAC.7